MTAITYPLVNGVIVSAELVLANSRYLRVPIREGVEVLRNAFLEEPYRPGDHLIVLVDGRVYRDVLAVTYVNEDGSKYSATSGEKI